MTYHPHFDIEERLLRLTRSMSYGTLEGTIKSARPYRPKRPGFEPAPSDEFPQPWGWFDAADLSGGIASWADQSGNGNDLTLTAIFGLVDPVYEATGGPNGLPAVEFSEQVTSPSPSANYYESATIDEAWPGATTFIVGRHPAPHPTGNPSFCRVHLRDDGSGVIDDEWRVAFSTLNQTHIRTFAAANFDAETVGESEVDWNDALFTDGISVSRVNHHRPELAVWSHDGTTRNAYAPPSDPNPWDVETFWLQGAAGMLVSEVLQYDRPLSDSDATRVRAYLADKYDL